MKAFSGNYLVAIWSQSGSNLVAIHLPSGSFMVASSYHFLFFGGDLIYLFFTKCLVAINDVPSSQYPGPLVEIFRTDGRFLFFLVEKQ